MPAKTASSAIRRSGGEGVDLQTIEWNGTEGPAQKSFDLFDDGSIKMINIPGHCDGLCAV